MKTILLLVLFIISGVVNAQISPQWVRGYNGSANNNDEAADITTDTQNNIIITGRVISTGNNTDICVIKYSPSGSQLWAAVYNGPGNNYDDAAAIATDNAGNIYVTGKSLSGEYDIVVLKYSPAGVQQWAQLWNGAANETDYANAITVDNSGNVYVTGTTESTGTNYNYVTLKYNSTGVLQWARTYNNPVNGSYDEASFIEVDASSNVYITGESDGQGSGTDFYTIKYSASGDSNWSARYTSSNNSVNDIPQGFSIDANGNVYVTGFTSGTSSGIDYMTIKYNSSGAEQWQARYTSPGGSQDIPEDLAVDAAGNVYVTGRTRINSSYNDFGTVKYNSLGVQQWLAVYNNTGVDRDDYGYELVLDPQGNIYVAGYSQSDGSDSDALTLKYNSAGVQQWVARFDSTNSEEAYAIALDSDNNVCITGYYDPVNTDLLTIKYSQTTSVTSISSEIPVKYILGQNYPNPFNPETNINFSIPQKGYVKVSIFDISGKEVAAVVNSELPAGEYRIGYNASGLTSGVYFYTLRAGSFTETKKMLLLK